MGEQLIKPYQISVWEDRLVTSDGKSYYDEVKIAEIGSDTMTSKNRVYSPVLKVNTNGEKTLTFSLKYKYFDEVVGDFVVNPIERFLVNERKVKLFYKDEWYDFVVKEKEEESEEYTFSYTCTDAFIQELAKNGYGVTFNTELNNNQGTVVELAEAALEGTDWIVDRKNSDLLKQTISEPICKCEVEGNFDALNLDTNEIETIEDEDIYIFYSYITNRTEKYVQFLRAADREKWSYDDNNAIIGTNYRILGDANYTESNDSITINYGSAAINVGDIDLESQGYRLVYGQRTTYDPILKKTVDIYNADYDNGWNQEIYHYIDYQYGTTALVSNFITNGTNFTTYNGTNITGWSEAVDTNSRNYLDLGITTYPELTTAESLAQISELKEVKGYLELEFPQNSTDVPYAYSFYNSGITDSAPFVGNIAGGEKFLFRTRYQYAYEKHFTLKNDTEEDKLRAIVAGYTLERKVMGDGSTATVKKINPLDIYFDFDGDPEDANIIISNGQLNDHKNKYIVNNVAVVPSTKYVYIDNDIEYVWNTKELKFVEKTADNFTDYYYLTATAKKSFSKEKLSNTANRIGLFIYKNNTHNQYVYVEDIELTRYYEDANGNPIFIGSTPEAKTEVIDKYYLKPNDNTTADAVEMFDSLEALADSLNIDADLISPVMNEECEKILSIEVSKSNYFNILQTLCETFECWLKINVEHDSTGRIKLDKHNRPIKKICFKEYIGKDNFAGFKYGINLNSISRSIDSNEFVTKLIVAQPASEYTSSGVLSITEADANPNGESYILNFNYYLNQGLIKNKEVFNADLNDFNQRLKEKNIAINTLNNELILALAALEHAKANRNVYVAAADTAAENYAKTLDNFEAIAGMSYSQFLQTNQGPDKIAKNSALLKAINEIYAAAVEMNSSTDLLESVNKEYNDLYIKCYGMPTYGVTVTTFRGTEGLPDSTKLVLSDYVAGVKCRFTQKLSSDSSYGALSTQWTSGINDKDFIEDKLYDLLVIQSIPNGYEIEYTVNGNTVRAAQIPATLDITQNDEGMTKNFRIVPSAELEDSQIGLVDQINALLDEKSEIEAEFYAKYSRFIQEGTWESTDYIDPNLYYLDAVEVSNVSAQPKVSYTINVMEISELKGYENYEFNVGDKTYIEDTDFFGWEVFEISDSNGQLIADTPVKELVIVSEVEWHLDEPENNVITIQNYKTQFEDLFQRISAAVQSVQYNQASYARAASILDENGHINSTLLVGSLNSIAGASYDLTPDSSVVLTGTGIITRNPREAGNQLAIRGEGIEISNDGGLSWKNIISADGINADVLNAGTINTNEILIMDGENPSFRWDSTGISALGLNDNGTYDLNTYVRYDKYGLYGVQDGEGYVATSLDDIKDKASFGLTWDGFFIKNKYRDGYVSISSTDDFQVVANGTERIKIGHFDDDGKYGIRIKNDNGRTVFETDDNGNLTIAGTLRSGDVGSATAVVVSSDGYGTSVPIAGSNGFKKWAIAVGNTFGVDQDGHLYATAASIRGNIMADSGSFSGNVDATSGTFSNEVRVGSTDKYIVLQGYANRPDSLIASSDYIENPNAGWAINGAGDAIFNNVSVRGAIKTAVFEYNELEAVGGAFLFRPSSTIRSAKINGNDLILTLEQPNIFAKDEWVKLSNLNLVEDPLGGLVYVYKIINVNGKEVTLENAAEIVNRTESEEFDGWGQLYVIYEVENNESPETMGLYELNGEDYILTLDSEPEEGKTYYKKFTTVEFARPYSEDDLILNPEVEDLTDYIDLFNADSSPVSLNASKYTIYFGDSIYLKEVIIDTITVPQNSNVDYKSIVGTISAYIGNLSLFSLDLANTGEDFLLAQYEETITNDYTLIETEITGNPHELGLYEYDADYDEYVLTNDTEAIEGKAYYEKEPSIENYSYTRLYSSIQGTVNFVLIPYDESEDIIDLEGGALVSFGVETDEVYKEFPVTLTDNPQALGLYEFDPLTQEYVLTEDNHVITRNLITPPSFGHPGKIKIIIKPYYKQHLTTYGKNYGIGINSSDTYMNLPARAISLFESTIHPQGINPNNTLDVQLRPKITYDFKGILGTLPKLDNDNTLNVDPDIYASMQDTQGIYTNNMYIGDTSRYIAFYTDTTGAVAQTQLAIKTDKIILGADVYYQVYLCNVEDNPSALELYEYDEDTNTYSPTADDEVNTEKTYYKQFTNVETSLDFGIFDNYNGFIHINPGTPSITLGRTGGNTIQITNEAVNFLDADQNIVAWASQNIFHAPRGEYQEMAMVNGNSTGGNLTWIARSDGHLTLKVVN